MNTEECTLWMGDIEPWMDESFIMKAFNKCGFKPNNIKIIKNKMYRNFGFVNFDNFQDANNAIFKLNARQIPQTNKYFKLNLTKSNKKQLKMHM
jgi:RNA recognition motif-containing protein